MNKSLFDFSAYTFSIHQHTFGLVQLFSAFALSAHCLIISVSVMHFFRETHKILQLYKLPVVQYRFPAHLPEYLMLIR